MKVNTIVEEATKISNRSGKAREDERREVEEKVIWIFHTRFLKLLSGGEVHQVCAGGEGDGTQQQERQVQGGGGGGEGRLDLPKMFHNYP